MCISGTTIFRNGKEDGRITNPSEETIKKYRNYIEKIGCTSDVAREKYGQGIIITEFNVLDGKVDVLPLGCAVEDLLWK